MKAKAAQLGSRHPKVVIIYGKEENVEGVSEVLTAHVNEYRAVALTKNTNQYLIETKPSVILFALDNIETCITYYATLIEELVLEHAHYTVLLCSNKESALAFRCCMKGLFDNYFVYQPLYEKFRLAMIVHNGLARINSATLMDDFNESNFEQIDEGLAKLIDESSQCRQSLLAKVEQGRDDIISSTANYTPKDVNTEQTAQELMAEVAEHHVKPLLSILESDIKAGLDSMIAQLVAAKSSAKAQAAEAKGLIHHKPALKKKGLLHHQPSIKRKKPNAESADENASVDAKHQDQTAVKVETQVAQKTKESAILDTKAANNVKAFESKHKILVVEDNALYRDMLVSVLRKEKFNVDQAEDGICALRKIQDEEYDLIIMDLFMPKLDGLNTTKKIRQISGGKDVPVIALTGNKSKDIIRKWASYGLKGYIIKPSTKDEIMNAVGNILGEN